MEFGIAFKGDLDHNRMLAISRQVEAGGFDYIWFFDSHIIIRFILLNKLKINSNIIINHESKNVNK